MDNQNSKDKNKILKKPAAKQKRAPAKNKKPSAKKLKLLITIVNRSKGEFYADLIQSFDVNMQMLCLGQGTAKAEMLHYLGLAGSDKTVIFSIIREDIVDVTLGVLSEKFQTIKNGKGIAFTVPLTSVIGVAIYGFLSNNKSTVKEEQNG